LLVVIEKSSRFARQFGGLAELDHVLFASSIFRFSNDHPCNTAGRPDHMSPAQTVQRTAHKFECQESKYLQKLQQATGAWGNYAPAFYGVPLRYGEVFKALGG